LVLGAALVLVATAPGAAQGLGVGSQAGVGVKAGAFWPQAAGLKTGFALGFELSGATQGRMEAGTEVDWSHNQASGTLATDAGPVGWSGTEDNFYLLGFDRVFLTNNVYTGLAAGWELTSVSVAAGSATGLGSSSGVAGAVSLGLRASQLRGEIRYMLAQDQGASGFMATVGLTF
jgi:hypothetical protein